MPAEAREDFGALGVGLTGGCEPLDMDAGSKLRSSVRAEPSLQLHKVIFIFDLILRRESHFVILVSPELTM